MDIIFSIILKISKTLHWIAGISLTMMMLLTVADVIGRAMGHPIMGTYEIMGLMGAIVVGFAIPFSSLQNVHIYMEFLLDRLSKRWKNIFQVFTRSLCVFLFIFIGYNLIQLAGDYRKAGEVSLTLQLPIYPFIYGVAFCCFVESLIFISDILRIAKGIK